MPPVQRIGGYEVLGALGHGAAGVVFRARDPRTGAAVALKVLRAEQASPLQRERFLRELRALAALDHEAIVRVLDQGEDQGRPFLVMELCEGGSLEQRLAREGPLPEGEAVLLVLRLARAIAHAHERRLVHRDLKPANVLFGPRGAVVTDFNLVRSLDGDSARLSVTGHALGTPGFMAPEQASGDKTAAGTATDVYGLGAILYAALTGRPPITGEELIEVLVATASRPIEPPSIHRAGLTRAVDALCLRCLEKEPARRFASADELARALEAHAAALASGTAGGRRAGIALAAVAVLATVGAIALATHAERTGVSEPKATSAPAATPRAAPAPAPPPVPAPPPPPPPARHVPARGWNRFAAGTDLLDASALARLPTAERQAYLAPVFARATELALASERAAEAPLLARLDRDPFELLHRLVTSARGLKHDRGLTIEQVALRPRPDYDTLALATNGKSALVLRFHLGTAPASAILKVRGHASGGRDGVNFAPLDIEVSGTLVARAWVPALGVQAKPLEAPPAVFDVSGLLLAGDNTITLRLGEAALTQAWLGGIELWVGN